MQDYLFQLKESGMNGIAEARLFCPILYTIMSTPVSITETQTVRQNNTVVEQSKKFLFDYRGLKEWYKNSRTNPLTRTPMTWSAVQPEPSLVESVKMFAQDKYRR